MLCRGGDSPQEIGLTPQAEHGDASLLRAININVIQSGRGGRNHPEIRSMRQELPVKQATQPDHQHIRRLQSLRQARPRIHSQSGYGPNPAQQLQRRWGVTIRFQDEDALVHLALL